ncbi:MAG: glycosyltransferase [Arenibacterium sp.]
MTAETRTKAVVAAIVVTFNRLGDIKKTVARLEAEAVDHIVVVDNGSSDGTPDWLAGRKSDRFHPILNPHNLGGAGGFATGLDFARRELDTDWVMLSDDDGRPEPGAMAAFHALDLIGVDGVVSAVFLPSGKISDMNRPLRNPFRLRRNLRTPYRLSEADYDRRATPQRVDMATYVGLFLSRRALQKVSGPDPRLFIYGDDLIHTLQLSQAGMRLEFVPQVRFEHDCETLIGNANIYSPVWKVYYHYRNAILLYRLAAGWLLWPVLALRLPKWHRAARHYGKDAETFRRLLSKAIRDGIRGRLDNPPGDVPQLPKE